MAKKKLSDNLRPASFRGVPFQVDSADMGVGRRTQLHEYPQRDKPYAEDLGRSARDLSFYGFVVGDDYVDQANKLIDALEAPGPATLVHPWFGSLKVAVSDKARVSFDASLGVARFQLAFVEAGELDYPGATTSTQAATRIAATNLEAASVKSFAERFSVKGFQDFVTAAANGYLTDKLGFISTSDIGKALGFANGLASSLSSAIALVSSPTSLGWKVMGMFGLSGVASTASAWGGIVRSLSSIGRSSRLADSSAPANYTPSRQQATQNANAVNAISRQAMLVQAVGASSLIGSPVDSNPPDAGEMLDIRNALTGALDAEMLVASDTVYEALWAAKMAVWKDLTERARSSDKLVTRTPPDVLPALVLAYEYHEDALRDAELVQRNAVIRHPGFVPAVPLKVLTQ